MQLTGRNGRRVKEVEARSLKSQSQMSYAITAIGQDIPSQIVGPRAVICPVMLYGQETTTPTLYISWKLNDLKV